MTKGEQIVALAMEKVSREGYPKLTEDHPFFGRLRAFMVDKHYWMGTATDLLTEEESSKSIITDNHSDSLG